jgi:hypothetical protein
VRKELSPKLSEKGLVFRLLGHKRISYGLSLRWRAIIGLSGFVDKEQPQSIF